MVELLIGMIGSGKSIYSNKRAKEGAIVLNDDSIVLAVHGGNYSLYDKKLKPLYKQVETAMFHTAIAMGKDIVIDRTNLSKSQRTRYISLAKSLDQDIVGVIFPIEDPEIHAARRYKHDSRGVSYQKWCGIADFHFSQYEEPQLNEGFNNFKFP